MATFTEENLNGKLCFSCNECVNNLIILKKRLHGRPSGNATTTVIVTL